MFKSLRKKLSRFEEDLEAELEKQLEDELEAELAASLERAPAVPDRQEVPQEPKEGSDEPVPTYAEDPTLESADPELPEHEVSSAPPSPEAAPDAPSVRKEDREAEHERGPTRPPVPEREHAPPREEGPKVGVEPAAERAGQLSKPAEEDRSPAPKKERVRRPGGPVKKTDEDLQREIEASVERELTSTMETQRELERVVREGGVSARVRIPDEKLDDLLWELEMSLLESDVALPVTEAIKNNVREQLKEARVAKRDVHSLVERVLKTAIRNVLNEPFDFDGYVERADKPAVIMFVGVNGTGKTTAIAKIANRLKQNGKSVVLAAGDTFRAGAVQQLQQHADRLGVKMIKHEGKNADPAAVAFDAIDHAKSRNKDVVLIDTAGRMGTNVNLMDEMEKIKRVSQPDLIFFVGDSLAGNDAVSQADKFNDVVGIDGVILTKVDADAKGGAALSVAYAIGKPLVFIGLGQEYEDQVPFDRDWMVARLFSAEAEEAMAAA